IVVCVPAVLNRRESSAVTRQKLIASAIDILRGHGPAAAATGRIAAGAGLKQASFYAHFPDRDACLTAAAAAIGEQMLRGCARRAARPARPSPGGAMTTHEDPSPDSLARFRRACALGMPITVPVLWLLMDRGARFLLRRDPATRGRRFATATSCARCGRAACP